MQVTVMVEFVRSRHGGGGDDHTTRWRTDHVLAIMAMLLIHTATCAHQYPDTDVRLTQEDIMNLQQDQLTPYRRMPKAVSIVQFTDVLKSANSYHDVLRAFYGGVLTNSDIDSIMSQSSQRTYYSSAAFGRPRIGGLTDRMAFHMAPRNAPHGSALIMHDDATMLRSSPVYRSRRRHRHGAALYSKTAKRQRKRKEKRQGNNKKKQDHIAALEHCREMEARAQCRHPVPVVLRIRDISNAASKVFFPDCTIVHRCRADTGCCNATSTCASSANTTIQRSFFALEYIKAGDKVLPGRRIVETLTFINHTACACAPIQQIPECQECPYPFYLRRENKTDCTCDCFYRDHTCIHIKKGKSPLDEQQLTLIKEGRRLRPKCQYGVFGNESVRTGYCPSRRAARLAMPGVGDEMVSGYGAGDSAKRRGNWG